MIAPVFRMLLTSALFCLLTACGGGDPTVTETVLVYAPTKHASMKPHASQSPVRQEAVLVSSATDGERQAEELRMVDMEQKLSLELNRRHEEQVERESRIASNARAGVVQSPGCEDTVGHDSVVCEQRVASL